MSELQWVREKMVKSVWRGGQGPDHAKPSFSTMEITWNFILSRMGNEVGCEGSE